MLYLYKGVISIAHYWQEEEVKFLKENYYKIPIKEIASQLNLKYQQVVTKAHGLGMNKKKETGENWNLKEDKFLLANFEYASRDYLLRHISRSWASIYQRGLLTHNLNRRSQDKYYINHKKMNGWSQEIAYILGFILADGYIIYKTEARNQTSLQIELAEYDIDILHKIKSYLEFEGPVSTSNRNTVKLNISNMMIIESIINKGYPIHNKTFETKWIEDIPNKYINHFIRGIFDGDGSVYEKNGNPTFQFLGTENLLEGIRKNLPYPPPNIHWRGKNGGANVYVMQYYNKKNFFQWLYKDATIFLDRKHNKFLEITSCRIKTP